MFELRRGWNGSTNVLHPIINSLSLSNAIGDTVGVGTVVLSHAAPYQSSYISGGTSPQFLDCSALVNDMMVTNTVSAALTIVLTNITEGARFNIHLPADGTGRAISVVPQLGTSTNWLSGAVIPTQTASLVGMISGHCFTHATGTNINLSYAEQ